MSSKELRLAARMLKDYCHYSLSPAGSNDVDETWLTEFSDDERIAT